MTAAWRTGPGLAVGSSHVGADPAEDPHARMDQVASAREAEGKRLSAAVRAVELVKRPLRYMVT